MLSAIVMCMWHIASISAVVTSIFMASSFLIRSVSLRACTIWNWMCLSFYASVEKTHLLANPQIHLINISGVSPALILISPSQMILHQWGTGWSMEHCKNSIKALALLFCSHSSAVALEGFHCLCFLHPMGPKKLSRYSSHVVSPFLTQLFRGMLFKRKGENKKSHQKWDLIVNLRPWLAE